MMATGLFKQPSSQSRAAAASWTRREIRAVHQLPAFLDELENALKDGATSLREQFAIRIALEEAIVNALRHGNQDDPSKVVRVCYRLGRRSWLATVTDEGPGFDHGKFRSHAGRGLRVMRLYMTWVNFNDDGNRVTLCRYLSGAAAGRVSVAVPADAATPLPFRRPGLIRLAPCPVARPAVAIQGARWLHVALAALLALPAIPVVLAAIALIRLTSRGPALYRQTRVGLAGKPFILFKLRTMTHACEKGTGPAWSMPGDPRITPLGRVLRALHIDELPQLWNVLRGEMSLVGPRPERPEFTRTLRLEIPHYDDRCQVLPGITGLAQVQLPPDTTLDDVRRKLKLDLLYIERRGLWLDLRLLAATGLKLLRVRTCRIRRWCCLPKVS